MRDAAAFDEALAAAEHKPPRPTGRLRRAERRAGVLFVIPAVVLYALLLALPIIQTFYYSLTRWNGINSTFIGLANYERLFTDPTFFRVVAQQRDPARSRSRSPSSSRSAVAFLLNEHVFGWRFFRSVYFLPTAISWVVIGIVAVRFFAQRGMLNSLLASLGIPVQTDMLATELSAMTRGGDHVHLVRVRHQHDHLHHRDGDARPRRLRGGPRRRRERPRDLPPHHHPAPDALHPVRLRPDAHHRLHGPVQPHLRDDAGRARLRHDHARVLRLPDGLRAGRVRLRRGRRASSCS